MSLSTQSPVEYFKDLVDDAMESLHVSAEPLTSFYVVALLSEFSKARSLKVSLAEKYLKALSSGGSESREGFKQVGDVSIFISGFFSDSLRHSLVDIDYYVSIGRHAYGALGESKDTLAPTYKELSEKFVLFRDVLETISMQAKLTSNSDILRMYERWVKTGSILNWRLLVEKGVIPNQTAKKMRIQ